MPRIYARAEKFALIQRFCEVVADIDQYPSMGSIHASGYVSVSLWTMRRWARADRECADMLNDGISRRAERYIRRCHEVLCGIDDFWEDSKKNKRERMTAVNKARLQVEHYRWLAAAMMPEWYGDQAQAIRRLAKEVSDLASKLDAMQRSEGSRHDRDRQAGHPTRGARVGRGDAQRGQ